MSTFYFNLHRKWIYTTFQKYGLGMIFNFFKSLMFTKAAFIDQKFLKFSKIFEIFTILNNLIIF